MAGGATPEGAAQDRAPVRWGSPEGAARRGRRRGCGAAGRRRGAGGDAQSAGAEKRHPPGAGGVAKPSEGRRARLLRTLTRRLRVGQALQVVKYPVGVVNGQVAGQLGVARRDGGQQLAVLLQHERGTSRIVERLVGPAPS